MDKILDQGIFASEREMSQMEETRNSIYNKFTSIAFENDVSSKNKDYDSASWVQGIFSYEDEAPIEQWLFNSVESLVGVNGCKLRI